MFLLSGPCSALQLFTGAFPNTVTFYSDFYSGMPVFVLPQSIFFDGSANVSTLEVRLDPPSDTSLEGLSFSTLGLACCFS